jgi:hypothetical protein
MEKLISGKNNFWRLIYLVRVVFHHDWSCTSCIVSYIALYAELELEVQVEQAQAEDFTNLDLDQGKPQCI